MTKRELVVLLVVTLLWVGLVFWRGAARVFTPVTTVSSCLLQGE